MALMFIPMLIASLFHYINEPVVTMRENPNADSEIVSQAVFAEPIQIQKEENEWAYIMTPDLYFGWVPSSSIVSLTDPYVGELSISSLSAPIYSHINDTLPHATLPFGSRLKLAAGTESNIIAVMLPKGQVVYVHRQDVAHEPPLLNKAEMIELSKRFLGLSYVWGGRSSFGYDCSGFVQMLYRQMGIILPRDSRLQVDDPRFHEVPLSELEPGDLIFFGKSEHAIKHVGLYIGNYQFIHTTSKEQMPWCRISSLSDFEWSGNSQALFPYRTARRLLQVKD
jgi:gamma-D-glutamyl-L-lysine dipeptidyl-peptidase